MKITLSQLESHLWESANILRGPVDAADFKTYIFPLLFFKRICDVWDEEYDEIVDETSDTELALFPESHRFQIPDGCHWNDVRAVATNVGNGDTINDQQMAEAAGIKFILFQSGDRNTPIPTGLRVSQWEELRVHILQKLLPSKSFPLTATAATD